MSTTIEFPETLFRQGEQIARLQGVTLEEFVIRVLERELSVCVRPNARLTACGLGGYGMYPCWRRRWKELAGGEFGWNG